MVDDTKVEVSFRFLNLDKFQALTLSREVNDATYETHAQKDCFIGRILLKEQNLDDINHFFIRQKVDIQDCDIFICAQSQSHSNTFNAPRIVNQILKDIDCKLTFSVTSAEDRKL
ncbi:hypothetical protein [Aliiglaciecola sp. LCG003]|uniref:hypothetical protein n=1 Tax=Aliiglaciecola sp. LCG003 TaxID=3053655 RepID=UPI0025730E61|nr:hypothetical protein [Aliiglaciecola sp. LCG003]WJG07712.1 hypothetical protein QR722_10065 [Aliiglaciecola sp. LCG003]